MTDEEDFQRVVIERIHEARRLTGYPFTGLLSLIGETDAVTAARRLILNSTGEFQQGMIALHKAGLLHLSVEQAVIEFGERDAIFSEDEVEVARERLQTIELLLKR
ncbi:hypothetical protein ACVWXN_008549 [Bradyrhizobium sp. i1.4.4]